MGNNIISSLGAGSGIDIKSLVEGLVSVERAAPEQRLDRKQEKLEAQISSYGTLSAALDEFKGILDPLTNPDLFSSRSASFPSNNEFITANSLDPEAQTGTFNIEAVQLAQSQSLASAAVADPSAQLLSTGDGTQQITVRFGKWDSYTVGGGPVNFTANADKETLTLDITEGKSSLDDIAEAINDSDSGLQATVLDDGSGSSQLLITTPSGEQQSVEISVSDPKLSVVEFKEGAASLEQKQASQDAIVEVNGLSVSRESNTINDVVQGFDFTLNKASAGEVVTFSIEEDKATAEQAIRDFVDAYNTFTEVAKNLTGVTEDEETGEKVSGALSSDGSAKSIVNTLLRAKSELVTGLTGNFSYLANVGIETNLDGTIEINEEKFTKALDDNFDDIASLFARSSSSDNSAIEVGTKSSTVPQNGTYTVEVTQDPRKANVTTGVVNLGDFPINTGVGGTYSFEFNLHGTQTNTITLPDNQDYNSPDDLASALQSAINGDENIKADQSLGVVVSFDSGSNQFIFESKAYGRLNGNSTVSFGTMSASFASLTKASSGAGAVETAGLNVEGTINGEAAFGSGNILLANIDSDADGLLLTISPGAVGVTSTINFSGGFAGDLVSTINGFLAENGTIEQREERINEQLEDITTDREELEERMSKFEIRYYNQFLAMEAILNGLSGTSNQLDNILQTLPFTADKN